MPDTPAPNTTLRVPELSQRKPHRFALKPEANTCAQIAEALDLLALRKLSFVGALHPEGKTDWRLEGDLGATAVQPCVLTLAPVTTRIDAPVLRRFQRDTGVEIESDEMEMPEDDSTEPLGEEIDLISVLTEALALALPDYPRADGAALEQATFAADGISPMSDDDAKPFAGLAALKQKLEDPKE